MQCSKMLAIVSSLSMIFGANATNITEMVPVAGKYAAGNFTAMASYMPQVAPKVVGGLTWLGWIAYNTLRDVLNKPNNVQVDKQDALDDRLNCLEGKYDKDYIYELPEQMKIAELTYEKSAVSSLMDNLYKISPLMDKALSYASLTIPWVFQLYSTCLLS